MTESIRILIETYHWKIKKSKTSCCNINQKWFRTIDKKDHEFGCICHSNPWANMNFSE